MIRANIINEDILRQKIIKLALLQLDKEYIHGKHGPDSFDCAGFVWYIYNQVLNIDIYNSGIGLSTTTRIMTSTYGENSFFNDDNTIINSGDILFFHMKSLKENKPSDNNKYPGHCGIYLYDNNFIHCTSIYKKVSINNLENDLYWSKKLVASKNIFKKPQ